MGEGNWDGERKMGMGIENGKGGWELEKLAYGKENGERGKGEWVRGEGRGAMGKGQEAKVKEQGARGKGKRARGRGAGEMDGYKRR